MKRALILDANQRSALAVTRSLGRRGVPLITADETSSALAGRSKYSGSYFKYPSPKTQSVQFIDFLADFIPRHEIDVVIPMTELTTTLLLSNQSAFSHVILPFADLNTVDALADKCQLMRMAATLSIPIPKTWFVETVEALPELGILPYPLVLKPGKSWQPQEGIWSRRAVRFAQSPSEVTTIVTQDPAFHGHPFLLQECVTGVGQGVFALYDHGRPVVFFAHRRLREKPPSGGVSVLCESIPVDPQLLAHAKALLDKVGWHGVAMVEFKVDPQTDTPYLMEVNTRFWGSLQLAIYAGVDFPWLLYQLACGASPGASEKYRIGIRSRWLLGDIDNLYLTMRDRQNTFRDKLAALAEFLTPHPLRTRHEVNRWGDPGPFWYELKHYIHDLLKLS
jgi:predicted ATP-grasp superfamily ATP-dependent carboligase